jgi:hypothetical protein
MRRRIKPYIQSSSCSKACLPPIRRERHRGTRSTIFEVLPDIRIRMARSRGMHDRCLGRARARAGPCGTSSFNPASDLVKVAQHRYRCWPAPGAMTPQSDYISRGQFDLQSILGSPCCAKKTIQRR